MYQVSSRAMLNVYPPYKGGCTTVVKDYIFELAPEHPQCNGWGYVAQHRLVADDKVGRFLSSAEHVHHRDGNPLNNHPDNLQIVTRSEHMALHRAERAAKSRAPITEESVSEALQGRSVKDAAALLGVHTQTLRNRFPELLAPRVRKSPTKIDDPAAIALILEVAPDPLRGYREIASQYGISFRTVKRICDRNGIAWVKRTKKGEVHRQYRRKSSNPPESELDD